MDQQITSVIVNRKEHKLKKGCGYHLDMLVCGIMIGVCSLLGLPWCVAATVLCLGHVDSLKMDSQSGSRRGSAIWRSQRTKSHRDLCLPPDWTLCQTCSHLALHPHAGPVRGLDVHGGQHSQRHAVHWQNLPDPDACQAPAWLHVPQTCSTEESSFVHGNPSRSFGCFMDYKVHSCLIDISFDGFSFGGIQKSNGLLSVCVQSKWIILAW